MDFHLKESSAQREIRALVERIPSLGPRVRQLVKEHAEGTGMVAKPIHSLCLEVRDRGAIETRLPIATVGLVREQGLKDLAGTAVSSMVNNVAAVSVSRTPALQLFGARLDGSLSLWKSARVPI
jgi:hypothetical protein